MEAGEHGVDAAGEEVGTEREVVEGGRQQGERAREVVVLEIEAEEGNGVTEAGEGAG